MILTGNCKDDFNKWLYENDECYFTDESMRKFNDTLFIYWFDTFKYNEVWSIWDYAFKVMYEGLKIGNSVIEIQKQAIIKANEIYNTKFKKADG